LAQVIKEAPRILAVMPQDPGCLIMTWQPPDMPMDKRFVLVNVKVNAESPTA